MQRTSYDFLKSYDALSVALKKHAGEHIPATWLLTGYLPADGSIHTLGESAVDTDTANKLILCHALKSRARHGYSIADRDTIPLIFFMDHLTADILEYIGKKSKEAPPFMISAESTFYEVAQVLEKHKQVNVIDQQSNYMGIMTRKLFIQGIARGAEPDSRVIDAVLGEVITLTNRP